jgi:hypothetical protein
MHLIISEKAIGHFQIIPDLGAYCSGGIFRLQVTQLHCATRTQFAFCKIQETYCLACQCMLYEGATATHFYIIGVGAYCQYVQLHYLKIK